MAFPFGALASIAAPVIGGIFGARSQKDAIRAQNKANRTRIQTTVKDAKAAGIHPLAALGAAGAPMYQPIVGNPMGEGIAQGIANAGTEISNASADKQNAGIDQLNKELTSAQIDLIKAQTGKVASEIQANARGGTTGATNFGNPSLPPNSLVGEQASNSPTLADTGNLFVKATGLKGDKVTVPDMKIAPDLETTFAAHLESGTVVPWVKQMLGNNITPSTIYSVVKRLTPAEQAKEILSLAKWAVSQKGK